MEQRANHAGVGVGQQDAIDLAGVLAGEEAAVVAVVQGAIDVVPGLAARSR